MLKMKISYLLLISFPYYSPFGVKGLEVLTYVNNILWLIRILNLIALNKMLTFFDFLNIASCGLNILDSSLYLLLKLKP